MFRSERLIFSLLLPVLLFYAQKTLSQSKRGHITVLIKLQKPSDTFSIKPALLKYNKDFAFSFTLDDGLTSAYLVAYPFFNGGTVSGKYMDQWGSDQGADGRYYPGLYYTDGCGNRIPFRAASAINAKNVATGDSILHPGFLSWKQISYLSRAGWDLLNHGYAHTTGKKINAKYQITENNRIVEDSLNIKMKDFVIPGGKGDYLSDGPYTTAAFALGMETVQCEHFGSYLIKIDSNLNLKHLKLGREFLHSMHPLYSRHKKLLTTSGINLLKEVSVHLYKKNKFWINAFTHSVGNYNLWNISFIFPEFKTFFNQLALQYGSDGRDNIWMAPTQEVFEYLLVYRTEKYKIDKKRRQIKIIIDTDNIPADLKYYELTLLLQSAGKIKKAKCRGCVIESYSKERDENIINLNW